MPSIHINNEQLQLEGPVIDISLSFPLYDEQPTQTIVENIPAVALIDTGATVTVVQEKLLKQLNLTPIEPVLIQTPSSSDFQCYRYYAKIILNKEIDFEFKVIAAPLQNQHIQCLIGRDILEKGIMFYNGNHNSFTLSF